MSAAPDPEPRRSVRATKGQHKALEQLDLLSEPPKRRGGGGKKKKAAPEPEEQPEEEIIRCVCGATEQDEDSGEPWIACDQCGAWQHNICMGMSQYTEDLPKEYFCELCRPENHKELLAGIQAGERPWEARRKAYEEEKAEKRKRGPKKGKKRASDQKEEALQKAKQSPPPPPEPKKEVKAAGQKRKTTDGVQEKEAKQKIRKVTETQAVPVQPPAAPSASSAPAAPPAPSAPSAPSTTPASEASPKISELPDTRQGPAKLLCKSLNFSLGIADKNGQVPNDGMSIAERAERFALEIERAVHDSHPTTSSYASQIRTLAFNLKGNPELTTRLLEKNLTPAMLASMTTEELASKELQRETAEMRARAEKQSIKITDDFPRIRKTHKGEEFISDDGFAEISEEIPSAPVRRPTAPKQEPKETTEMLQDASRRSSSAQTSPTRADFDLNKVFSSVKAPSVPQTQVPAPLPTAPAAGPGVDPDVDRLLDDGTQSPPYSPKEELDPDVVWRGNLVMNTLANVSVIAKHAGGANLSETIGLPWNKLIPKTLTVCGRIDEQQAIVYLCSLRYSLPTDVVVVNLEPTTPAAREGMQKLIDYFVSKKRYGVIGDKGVANVRDTYLVPVLPGAPQPEFMLNLADNYIPEQRTEPMMLAVFVYRNDPETIQRIHGTTDPNHVIKMHQAAAQAQAQVQAHGAGAPNSGVQGSPGNPTPMQTGFQAPPVRQQSISAPAFSPTSPQGPFPQYPSPRNGTPVQHPPASHPPQQHHPAAAASPPQPPKPPAPFIPPNPDERQRQGEAIAREVLGPLITSPTVAFLLPQAHNMHRKEWEVIKRIFEADPRAREDLPYLSNVLEKQSQAQQAQQQQLQQQQRERERLAQQMAAGGHQQVHPVYQQQQQHHPAQGQPHPQVHPQYHHHQAQQQQHPGVAPHPPPPQPQPHTHQVQPAQHQHQPQSQVQHAPPQQQQPHPHPAPIRQTPIPPPPIPPMPAAPTTTAGGPPRQTPIPPPQIPPPPPHPQPTQAPIPTAIPAPVNKGTMAPASVVGVPQGQGQGQSQQQG